MPGIIPALPFTLTNGTVADANQVMSDLNTIVTGANANAAHLGANSDITSLSALSTPLSPAQGGTGTGTPGAAGNMLTSNGGGLWQSVAPGQGLQADPGGTGLVMVSFVHPPGGRLSLSSGVAVQTADVNGSASIFYVPYVGNSYPWYDGTRWNERIVTSQLTLALDSNAGHTGYQQATKNFDLFLYNDAGTDRLVSGPAWTNDTTRAAAVATFQGIMTNSAIMIAKFDASANTLSIPANQATYVGTFRAAANGLTSMIMSPAGASGGSLPQLLLWNYYNRVLTLGVNTDSGVSYTYTSNVTRQARASANNQIFFITGFAEDGFVITRQYNQTLVAVAGAAFIPAFGLDSTTASDWKMQGNNSAAQAISQTGTISKNYAPQIGFHFVSMNETGDNINANTVQSFNAMSGLFRM